MSDQQCCGNCQYWRRAGDKCLRYPPEHTPHVGGCVYPTAGELDWCGEWQVRTNRELSPQDRETLERGKQE